METPMQGLINYLFKPNEQTDMEGIFSEFLEQEKQVITDAFSKGITAGGAAVAGQLHIKNPEEYYANMMEQ